MRICGILSWYDEEPELLERCVSGWAPLLDHLVAVDGAYELYPNGFPRSASDEVAAIRKACEAGGVALTVHRPAAKFPGELEKRNLTLRLAGALLEPFEDWVVVFDADCVPIHMEPEAARAVLSGCGLFSADYGVVDVARRTSLTIQDVHRWDPTLLYGPQHWMLSRLDGGRRTWVRAPSGGADRANLSEHLVVRHEVRDDPRRRAAQEQYYDSREAAGAEKYEGGPPEKYGL